jgi:hypothetical protein
MCGNRDGGAGPFLSNDPAPFEGACATRVRRRTGISRACGALVMYNQTSGGGIRRSSDQR